MPAIVDPAIAAIGERIRQARLERDHSQTTIANALEVAKQTVSSWERGVAPPELRSLLKFCTFVGVDVRDILGTSSAAVKGNSAVVERHRRATDVVAVYRMEEAAEIFREKSKEDSENRTSIVGVLGEVSRRARGIRVDCRCNEPRFFFGDIVIIDPIIEPQPREFVLATINDKPVLRRYLPKSADTTRGAILLAEDRRWPQLTMGRSDELLGTLVQSISTRRD